MSAVKERPILFSAPMVRAILAGTKTQTRRIVKPQPQPNGGAGLHPVRPYRTPAGYWNWVLAATGMGGGDPFPCPYGQPGDRLYVRETWHACFMMDREPVSAITSAHNVGHRFGRVEHYSADGDRTHLAGKSRSSIHMPRWASRIDLEVTGVRVERLNDISEADALAEGIQQCEGGAMDYLANDYAQGYSPASSFRSLWQSINGADSWAANPWVWCVEFKRVKP